MYNEHLTFSVYRNRVAHNIPESRLLRNDVVLIGELVDREFRVYSNVYELCLAKGCSRSTVLEHISSYLKTSYVEAVIKLCVAPDGRVFRSMYALCRAYNIYGNMYRNRLSKGQNIFDALTKPVQRCSYGKSFVGPDGRVYPSLCAMLREFSVPIEVFYKRRKMGIPISQCLVPPVHYNYKPVVGTWESKTCTSSDEVPKVPQASESK